MYSSRKHRNTKTFSMLMMDIFKALRITLKIKPYYYISYKTFMKESKCNHSNDRIYFLLQFQYRHYCTVQSTNSFVNYIFFSSYTKLDSNIFFIYRIFRKWKLQNNWLYSEVYNKSLLGRVGRQALIYHTYLNFSLFEFFFLHHNTLILDSIFLYKKAIKKRNLKLKINISCECINK